MPSAVVARGESDSSGGRFATTHAERLTPDAVQTLLQHNAYTTIQKYINMARQLNSTVAALYVPKLPAAGAAG